MSDVSVNQSTFNGNLPSSAVAEDTQSGGFDIVQVLWRWKWLPILGAIVGGCLGFLYFSRQPKTYEAVALIQVVNSLPSVVERPIFDASDLKLSKVDESMVIMSQAVLSRAVRLGRLTELSDFAGFTNAETVALLQSEESTLLIEPAAKDSSSTMLRVTFVSKDADVAAKVVLAVVDAYESYLIDEFKTVGQELSSIIEEAYSDLTARVNDLTTSSNQFKDANPDIVFVGDVANDPYHDTFLELHRELTQLRTKLTQLQSVALQAKESLAAGRSPESIIHLLALSGATTGIVNDGVTASMNGFGGQPDVDLRQDTKSRQIEDSLLFPLEIKLRLYSENLGEQHPSVVAIRKEVEMVKRQVEETRERERQLEGERERLAGEFREKTGLGIRSVRDELDSRLQALNEQVAVLQRQEKDLTQRAEQEKRMSRELQGMLDGYRILQTDREAVATLLAAYSEKLQEIDLMPKSGQRTLKRLNMPTIGSFYGPKLLPFLAVGAAIGFVLLSGLAVLMDLADRSYRNPSEIASDLGVQVLGHIPVMNTAKVKTVIDSVDPAICAIHHSKGRVAEAYRSVRTGLYFSNKGKALKVLQVTSPVPGDGKSTLSANIAVTMAQSGRRVLLIDADLRRPRVAKIFGIETDVGVAAVVSGKTEIEDAICTGPVANLSILPGGKRPPNPAEILSSERFRNMIELLRDKFDMIVIDTPPLLAVSDPGAVAGIVDGVLVTMRLRRNVKPLATRAKDILESVGANLLGVVINGVSSEAGYGYNYDYNDYRYAYKYGSNYRTGYGYRYGYGNYRYGYSKSYEDDLSSVEATTKS